MRISDGLALLMLALLAACGDGKIVGAESARGEDAPIACQPAGAATVERVCAIERTMGEQGLILTIHHPDGGFRRLLVVNDGRGVIAADGADVATVKMIDSIGAGREIEVSIAGNRYILPATVKAPAKGGK